MCKAKGQREQPQNRGGELCQPCRPSACGSKWEGWSTQKGGSTQKGAPHRRGYSTQKGGLQGGLREETKKDRNSSPCSHWDSDPPTPSREDGFQENLVCRKYAVYKCDFSLQANRSLNIRTTHPCHTEPARQEQQSWVEL